MKRKVLAALVAVALVVFAAFAAWRARRDDAKSPAELPPAATHPTRATPHPRARTDVVPSGVLSDAAEPFVVVGRLVDGSGAPIVGFDLLAQVVGTNADEPCTTDGAGRFRFTLKRPDVETAPPKVDFGRAVPRFPGIVTRRRVALVDLPPPSRSGETDVGDVRFRWKEMLATGVVVDADGRPLRGVEVRAMDEGFGLRSQTDDDPVVTDDAGRFRVLGEPRQGEIALAATLDGWCVAGGANAARATSDARIVMTQAGAISGAVRTPIPKRGVIVAVYGAPADNGDAAQTSEGWRRCLVNDEGTFEIRNLRPGTAWVQVRLGIQDDEVVLSLEDVPVVAGRTTRDPRLIDVDLAKLTTEFRVVAVDDGGAPLRAHLYFRRAGSRDRWKQAEIVPTTVIRTDPKTAARGIDVLVEADGRRTKEIAGAGAETKVVLDVLKPAAVRLRLAESVTVPPAPFALSARLAWIEPGAANDAAAFADPRTPHVTAMFGKDRTLTIDGVEPGRYRVVAFLQEQFGGASIETDPKSIVVTVGEDGAPVDALVGIDARELRRDIERREKR